MIDIQSKSDYNLNLTKLFFTFFLDLMQPFEIFVSKIYKSYNK